MSDFNAALEKAKAIAAKLSKKATGNNTKLGIIFNQLNHLQTRHILPHPASA